MRDNVLGGGLEKEGCVGKDMKKGKPLVGLYIGTITMENSMPVPQRIKNRTTINP